MATSAVRRENKTTKNKKSEVNHNTKIKHRRGAKTTNPHKKGPYNIPVAHKKTRQRAKTTQKGAPSETTKHGRGPQYQKNALYISSYLSGVRLNVRRPDFQPVHAARHRAQRVRTMHRRAHAICRRNSRRLGGNDRPLPSTLHHRPPPIH